jgi:hypothetical protein
LSKLEHAQRTQAVAAEQPIEIRPEMSQAYGFQHVQGELFLARTVYAYVGIYWLDPRQVAVPAK